MENRRDSFSTPVSRSGGLTDDECSDIELSQTTSDDGNGNEVISRYVASYIFISFITGKSNESPVLHEVHNMLKMLVKRADVTDKEMKKLRKEMRSKTHNSRKKEILPVVRVSKCCYVIFWFLSVWFGDL